MTTRARIAILGGGFAGLSAAMRLERVLKPSEAEITLVSRENFSLFTPMLPEVCSGGLSSRHVATPVRAQLKRTNFLLGDVTNVDFASRTVDIDHSILGSRRQIGFDHIVFALGSVTTTFGIPGMEERALPLKTLEDADRLRNQLLAMLELADVTTDPLERKRLLTFVFVGGGFSGVEAAGETLDFFSSIVGFYHAIAPSDFSVVLVEGGPKLLPELQAGMGEYSAKNLEKRGVRVIVGEFVSGADAGGITLRSGARVDAATIVWTAGARPAPLVSKLGIGTARGGALQTDRDFSVPGMPGVWALGDCASTPDEDGKPYPWTAQHAAREGPALADNIAATLRGTPTKPFHYRSRGMMASLGGRRGVAGLQDKFLVTGFLAFVLWRAYYLVRLPGLDRQVRVAFDWLLGILFPRDIAVLRIYAKNTAPDATPLAEQLKR